MPRTLALLMLLALLLSGSPAVVAGSDAEDAEAEEPKEGEEPGVEDSDVDGGSEADDEKDGNDDARAEDEDNDERAQDDERDDAEDDDEDERERWSRERREVRLDTDDDGFAFESRHDGREDELRVRFDAEDAQLEVRFEDKANGTEFDFRVEFVALLEFDDRDGDFRYGIGEPVLRRIDLTDQAWTFDVQPLVGDAHRITANATLDGGGTLGLRFVVTPAPIVVDGVLVRPTETKFDVLLEAFPFTSPTSRVGLETAARTELESKVDREDKDGLVFQAGELGGYYRWVNESIVDGRVEPVGVSVLESRLSEGGLRTESLVVFSYAQGERIVHDPSVGVARLASAAQEIVEALARGDLRVWGAAALGAIAAVAVTALPRLRRSG